MNQRTHRPIFLVALTATLMLASGLAVSQQRLGNLSSNPYDPVSISNPYGRFGSPYLPDSINNPFGAGS